MLLSDSVLLWLRDSDRSSLRRDGVDATSVPRLVGVAPPLIERRGNHVGDGGMWTTSGLTNVLQVE